MFDKIYKNKYNFSNMGNNFKFKVVIFHNKCKQVGLLTNAYIYDTSIILFS